MEITGLSFRAQSFHRDHNPEQMFVLTGTWRTP
jgi:hypothetical protein